MDRQDSTPDKDRRDFIKSVAAAGAGFALNTYTPHVSAASSAMPGADSPLRNTEGWTSADSFFGPAYIDLDEWRDKPVRHRYIHGGFHGTDTRFSFYFPLAERYGGRFLHFFQGAGGGDEKIAARLGTSYLGVPSIEHAFECGAYLVESNQGHLGLDFTGLKGDASILHWRANAQTARFSRIVAAAIYGKAPHHGYCYGGSGGGLNSIHCIERAGDVYDGAVPFVMPHIEQGTFFSTQLNAQRILRRKLAMITDAIAPGGIGDAFWKELTVQEREALVALYRLGYPRTLSIGPSYEAPFVTAAQVTEIDAYDPGYFNDFWTQPGYMGADRPESFAADLLDVTATVRRVVTGGEIAAYEGPTGPQDMIRRMAILGAATPNMPIGVLIEGDPSGGDPAKYIGASLRLLTGKAAGRELACLGQTIDGILIVTAGPSGDPRLFADVMPGDRMSIDNHKGLAINYWDRHHVEFPDYPERRDYVIDGRPIYPQRPLSPYLKRGPEYLYKFAGHMIIVQNLMDRGTWPIGPRRYEEKARAAMGKRFDERYRVYWNDHASHLPASIQPKGPPPVITTREVDYGGSVLQAVSDLIAWVEQGIEPPPSTRGHYGVDGDFVMAPTAAERRGIQPVISVTANGAIRADVRAGEPVRFEALAEAPPDTGFIVSAEWDFEGTGSYPLRYDGLGKSTLLKVRETHVYSQPGTYFPVLRVTTHRGANSGLRRIPNLGRLRVVVT